MMLIIVKNTTVVTWLSVLSIPLLFLSETSSVALTFSNTIEEAITTTNLRTTIGSESQSSSSDFFDAIALAFNTDEIDTKLKGNTSVKHKNENSRRRLEQASKRTFPECMEQKLSPKDCQTLIQKQIDDAGGHEVGDVTVKIQTPRTPEEFADSYWMVEVPINIYNYMACDRNQGSTFYPFKWNDGMTGTALDVADQDCLGLTAGECCLKIRNYGKQLTVSGYDDNKQCLSCFVHQEPLEPILNEETGQTDYLECKDLEDGTCVREQLTGDEVDALDLITAGRIQTAIESVETFQSNIMSCDTFDQLLEDLYNAAVVIKPLSIQIGRLACMICYGEHDLDLVEENASVLFQLEEILMMLKKHNPPKSSKENCIIIYTNTDGEVVKEPTLGGSRSNAVGKGTILQPGSCENDSDCGDTEWCFRSVCYENRCITDAPCDSNQICTPNYYYDDDYIICQDRTCYNDPSRYCGENAYCADDRGYLFCRPYSEVGEECGYHFDKEYNAIYGLYEEECKPSTAFCYDPNWCFYNSYELFNNGVCMDYGEELRICRDLTTNIVEKNNCNSDEYCDKFNNRCRPNHNLGECCDPTLNNCGYGIDDGKLTCAPYEAVGSRISKPYTCQVRCETNDDCEQGKEWCAPVDEDAESNAGSTERFCKANL